MSLRQVLEIREKEEEIRRTALPKFPMILIGAGVVLGSIGMMAISAGSTQRMNTDVMQPISFTVIIGFILAYSHRKNARRIALLELEVLKLKRRLAESAEE